MMHEGLLLESTVSWHHSRSGASFSGLSSQFSYLTWRTRVYEWMLTVVMWRWQDQRGFINEARNLLSWDLGAVGRHAMACGFSPDFIAQRIGYGAGAGAAPTPAAATGGGGGAHSSIPALACRAAAATLVSMSVVTVEFVAEIGRRRRRRLCLWFGFTVHSYHTQG